MADAELNAFFVYGTLMRGQRYHREYAGTATSAVPATATGTLYHLHAGYPVLVDTPGGRVVGQILAFPDPAAALERMDELEGYDPAHPNAGVYARVVREATPAGASRALACWTYVVPLDRFEHLRAQAVRVPGGDWAAFLKGAPR